MIGPGSDAPSDVLWLAKAWPVSNVSRILHGVGSILEPPPALTLDETGTWFRSFQVMTAPTIVMVNRNGKIVRRTQGFDATLPEALRSTVGK